MSYIPIAQNIHEFRTQALIDFTNETMSQLGVYSHLFVSLLLKLPYNSEEDHLNIVYAAEIMAFARTCENFQTFLVDVILLIFNHHPHALFKKKWDVRYAFEADDIEVLKRDIIEKEVSDLSYKGLGELNEFLIKSLGIDFFPNKLTLKRVSQLLAIRNVIVHSRAVITKQGLERLQHRTYHIGDNVKTFDIKRLQRYFFHVAKTIDREVCIKFSLDNQFLYTDKQ